MCCISEYNNHAKCCLVFGLIPPVLFLSGVCAATFWLQSSQWQSNSMQRGGTCFQKGWYPTDCQQRRPKLVAGMIIVVFTDLFWLICIGWLYFTNNVVLIDRHAIWWKEVLGWFPASFWKKRGKHLFLKTLMEQVILLNTLLLPKHETKWHAIFMYYAFAVLTSILVKTMVHFCTWYTQIVPCILLQCKPTENTNLMPSSGQLHYITSVVPKLTKGFREQNAEICFSINSTLS